MTNNHAPPDMSLSVIVMAYNEAATLESVVDEICREAQKATDIFEVIIMDDGSTDGTGALADRLAQANPNVRVVHFEQNRGIGEVLRIGYQSARNDLVTIFPADGQCPAESITPFVQAMANHDLVLAYIPKRHNPAISIILSKIERLLFFMLFGPMPRFQGIYMFRKSILDQIHLKSMGRGWIIQMELIIRAKRAGYRIASLPTECRPRVSGKSKATNLRSVIANLKQVLILAACFQRERFISSNE